MNETEITKTSALELLDKFQPVDPDLQIKSAELILKLSDVIAQFSVPEKTAATSIPTIRSQDST